MKLLELVPQSCFVTIATVKDVTCVDKLELFLSYNIKVIKHFSKILVSINYLDTAPQRAINMYVNTWKRLGATVIVSDNNRGHMFGTIDLEESALKYIKSNFPEVTYVFKSMDDVITSDALLEVEVEQADFYYLPGFSTESIIIAGSKEKYKSTYQNFESRLWTPQTTFFILNISNIDSFYGSDVNSKYNFYQLCKETYPNIKPWEIPSDIKFDCETHLGRATKDLKKVCLIEPELDYLLSFAETVGIGDPSHKNLYFKRIGVCHYHFYEEPVYEF